VLTKCLYKYNQITNFKTIVQYLIEISEFDACLNSKIIFNFTIYLPNLIHVHYKIGTGYTLVKYSKIIMTKTKQYCTIPNIHIIYFASMKQINKNRYLITILSTMAYLLCLHK